MPASQEPASQKLLKQLGLPAIAGSIAVLATHPLELTKIRVQLDNELAKQAPDRARKYQGFVDCFRKNWLRGGLAGVQSGIGLGVTREFFFNAIRIGLFEPITDTVHSMSGSDGPITSSERLAAGLTAGALGGLLINPVDVCKTRFQALGGLTGHQHHHQGGLDALSSLVRDEGVRGLFNGAATNTLRGFLGPGSQIVAYSWLKQNSQSVGLTPSSPVTHVACSLTSAAMSVACVNPVDVIRTRLYNQPFAEGGRGLWYAHGMDAAGKIASSEGLGAFYKGAGSHFARLGPHMVLVFVILEQLKELSR